MIHRRRVTPCGAPRGTQRQRVPWGWTAVGPAALNDRGAWIPAPAFARASFRGDDTEGTGMTELKDGGLEAVDVAVQVDSQRQ